jgi:hypothetical protein
MEVPLETIVLRVVEEVVRELKKQGVQVTTVGSSSAQSRTRVERVDLSGYKTPVLTERHINQLHESTGIVVVPTGTILSPKAKELLRDRKIALRSE